MGRGGGTEPKLAHGLAGRAIVHQRRLDRRHLGRRQLLVDIGDQELRVEIERQIVHRRYPLMSRFFAPQIFMPENRGVSAA